MGATQDSNQNNPFAKKKNAVKNMVRINNGLRKLKGLLLLFILNSLY